jgi:hypothetical protein
MMMRKEMTGPSFKPMGIDRWAMGEAGTTHRASFYFFHKSLDLSFSSGGKESRNCSITTAQPLHDKHLWSDE